MEKGIRYLRELAVLEMIYNDVNDEQSPTDTAEIPFRPAM